MLVTKLLCPTRGGRSFSSNSQLAKILLCAALAFVEEIALVPVPAATPASVEYARHELGRMADVWDAKTNDEISEHIDEAVERNEARLTIAIYALLAGVAPPLLYPIFLWILAGFRRSASVTSEAQPTH